MKRCIIFTLVNLFPIIFYFVNLFPKICNWLWNFIRLFAISKIALFIVSFIWVLNFFQLIWLFFKIIVNFRKYLSFFIFHIEKFEISWWTFHHKLREIKIALNLNLFQFCFLNYNIIIQLFNETNELLCLNAAFLY